MVISSYLRKLHSISDAAHNGFMTLKDIIFVVVY